MHVANADNANLVSTLIQGAIDPHTPFFLHRVDHCYLVGYMDAINGGCGDERVPVSELATWLQNRPGLLIRALVPLWE